MSNAWAKGSTYAWRRIRAFVLLRDGYRCRAHTDGWCARAGRTTHHTCTVKATHAHHTLGRAVTGDDPRFIVASCKACNLYIGQPTKTPDPPGKSATLW